MHIDSAIFITLAINLGLLFAFSWIGVRFIHDSGRKLKANADSTTDQVSKIVSRSVLIIPRLRILLRVRRLIKTSSDNDERPYLLPQY